MKKKGLLIVLSSPSGGGKTTIRKRLLQSMPELQYSVSATTRCPRPGEKPGVDYRFLSRDEFLEGVKEGAFVEWAEVHGHLYGTPRELLDSCLGEGKDVLVDVDVKGASHLKKKYSRSVLIFIVPPSWEELKRRLEKRGTDSPDEVARRLEVAKEEINHYRDYNYIVINENLIQAIKEVESIIKAERCRRERREEFLRSLGAGG